MTYSATVGRCALALPARSAAPGAGRLPARAGRPRPGGPLRRAHALARPAPEALRAAQRDRTGRGWLAAGARRPDGPGPERARRRHRRARGDGAARTPPRRGRPPPLRAHAHPEGTATLRRARRLAADSARE